jgi:transposase-like protein
METKTDPVLRDSIVAAYSRFSGNVSAVSRELGCSRSTVRRNIAKVGLGKKPIAGGKQRAAHKKETLPGTGSVKRYILTSAQNNTHVHEAFWDERPRNGEALRRPDHGWNVFVQPEQLRSSRCEEGNPAATRGHSVVRPSDYSVRQRQEG